MEAAAVKKKKKNCFSKTSEQEFVYKANGISLGHYQTKLNLPDSMSFLRDGKRTTWVLISI